MRARTATARPSKRRRRPKWALPAQRWAQVPRALGFAPLGTLLRQLCPPATAPIDHAIELGCGSQDLLGRLLPELSVQRWTLIDNDPGAIEAMQARTPSRKNVRLMLADASALHEVPDASIDLVVALCVSDQLPNPAGLVRELARVLRAGGLFIEVNDQTVNVPALVGQQAIAGVPQLEWRVPFPNPKRQSLIDRAFVTARYGQLLGVIERNALQGVFANVLLPYMQQMPRYLEAFASGPRCPEMDAVRLAIGTAQDLGLTLEPFEPKAHLVQRAHELFSCASGFRLHTSAIYRLQRDLREVELPAPLRQVARAYPILLRDLQLHGVACRSEPQTPYDQLVAEPGHDPVSGTSDAESTRFERRGAALRFRGHAFACVAQRLSN